MKARPLPVLLPVSSLLALSCCFLKYFFRCLDEQYLKLAVERVSKRQLKRLESAFTDHCMRWVEQLLLTLI